MGIRGVGHGARPRVGRVLASEVIELDAGPGQQFSNGGFHVRGVYAVERDAELHVEQRVIVVGHGFSNP